MNTVDIILLSTITLSAIIGTIYGVVTLAKKKSIAESFNLFIYSFLGGLLGAFIGSSVGFALGWVIYQIIPLDSGFMFNTFSKDIGAAITFLICWFLGTVIGGIKTIKPFTKLLKSICFIRLQK